MIAIPILLPVLAGLLVAVFLVSALILGAAVSALGGAGVYLVSGIRAGREERAGVIALTAEPEEVSDWPEAA